VPLVVLPDYLGTREYLPKCYSRWHYSSQEIDWFIYGGLLRSRLIRIHVLSDALPFEGVPTGVTRVANRCALKYHLYFVRIRLYPEKNLTHNFLPRQVL
jgi:hypothetical protein